MYNRILVALEAKESDVFETALSIATATDASLLLLHVLSMDGKNSPPSPVAVDWDYATPLNPDDWKSYQRQWQTYEEKGLTLLHRYTERAEAAGVTADFLQTINAPGIGIVQAAKTWRADLIVMGSHQRKGIQELMLGSVSGYVMHHASCSVIIVYLENSELEKRDFSRLKHYQTA
ncbi:MAG: universal stress protein [Cyanobacteria bacterium J06621_11]